MPRTTAKAANYTKVIFMLIKEIIKRLYEIECEIEKMSAERSELIDELARRNNATKSAANLVEAIVESDNRDDEQSEEVRQDSDDRVFNNGECVAIIRGLAGRKEGVSLGTLRRRYPGHDELVQAFNVVTRDTSKFYKEHRGNGDYYLLKKDS